MKLELKWLELFSTGYLVKDDMKFKLVHYLDCTSDVFKKDRLYWIHPDQLHNDISTRVVYTYKKLG